MAVKIPALLHKMSQSAQKAWYKKNNMEMPSTSVQTGGKSAAAAKRVKVAPRKASDVKPDSVRAINAARQAAYMAKGGRAPIGAAGSGGSSVMAGSNMSTAKGIIAGIKAGFNPKVSLSPYEGMTAKEKKAMKKEEVEQIDEGSKRMSAAVKLQRAFDREKTASDASRKRGEEMLAQARAEYAKKQAAKTNEEVEQVDEGAKEDAEKLLGGPVKEKPKMPPGKQPAGYRYVRGLARRAMKGGVSAIHKSMEKTMAKEEVEQIDEVNYKKYLKVSREKRPLTPSAVAVAMSAEKEGNPNPARKLRNTQDARKFANKQLTKQVAKTRPAQKFPVYEPGRKYVGDSVELDGPVIDENNLKSLKTEDTEMKYIEEKLTAADPASKWISDFVKSDNPKFAGKSKKERIQQALGAYYAAKGGKNEEVEQIDEVGDTAKGRAALGSYVKKKHDQFYQNRMKVKTQGDLDRLRKDANKNLARAEKRLDPKGPFANSKFVKSEEVGGKTPETDTEVSLAKMHGNPKKITYGDVIKARIASAKKKALNKG